MPKTYLALTVGCPNPEEGVIKAPLEKAGERSLISEGGKPAVTEYRVLDSAADRFALVEARPLTGRTHQIRAHLEYLGMPIAGDDRYFGGESRKKFAMIADKLHLHAYKIDLSVIYNKKLVLRAPLPAYFKADLEALGIGFKE